ncbi:MAG: FAD-binding protein [Acidobacteriota bacterium]
MQQQHRTNISNVLVIGSGGAGLRAAIAAHRIGAEVTVLGKRMRNDAHTVLASGGINAALGTVDPEDSWEQHFVDTYQEGYHLAEPRAVEILVREAPELILEMAEWGTPFARTAEGTLDQRYFGAHKYRRTCYAGDYTGRALLQTLTARAEKLEIPIHDLQYVSRLLVDHSAGEPVCFGAMTFDVVTGERTVYLADAVVLAAGGHTRIWRRSSSRRDENTGDAMRLALRAGCELADMELVQFHPTGMVFPETMAGTLVTEAVRGEGGHLLNSRGERFMERYDAERMELSTRDRVALANYTEIVEGRGTENQGVYLDISHRSKDYILDKLPRMYRQFMESQMLDISKQPMEVAPTAHYTMGGVVVEPESHATRVRGLYAAGECTSGVHGANRLGGNSLAEILVFGKRAGRSAAEYSAEMDVQRRSRAVIRDAHDELDRLTKHDDELARPLQRAVRDIMWADCGVVRHQDKLQRGLDKLRDLRQAAERVDVRPSAEGFGDLALVLDLLGSLDSAEASMLGAIERRESRGSHQRSDYPEIEATQRVNIITELGSDGALQLTTREINPVPAQLVQRFAEAEEIQVAGRLLE